MTDLVITAMTKRSVFITGATGYIGKTLAEELVRRGHIVRALVRSGSEKKLGPNCGVIKGDPLDESSFASFINPSDTFVQLIGVPRPSPTKARQFREIDLASVRASVNAAVDAGIQHFVYVSVAQPAPVMKAYIAVRAEGEKLICESGIAATIIRPWYVLGPGHRWPYLLMPFYWLASLIPSKRQTAERLGLVTHAQMIDALVSAVENPPTGVEIIDVPRIRALSGGTKRPR